MLYQNFMELYFFLLKRLKGLPGSRRPAGGFRIADFGLWIDNGEASLPVGNHLRGNFFEVIWKVVGGYLAPE